MTSRPERRVALPYGLRRDGGVVRSLFVRALSGSDEMAVVEALAGGTSAARAATLLIGGCASESRGSGPPIGPDPAASLVLGDREVLLRAIHGVSVSDLIEAAVACAKGCGETIAFELDPVVETRRLDRPETEDVAIERRHPLEILHEQHHSLKSHEPLLSTSLTGSKNCISIRIHLYDLPRWTSRSA